MESLGGEPTFLDDLASEVGGILRKGKASLSQDRGLEDILKQIEERILVVIVEFVNSVLDAVDFDKGRINITLRCRKPSSVLHGKIKGIIEDYLTEETSNTA
ncbi:MAG: hypothetical protein PHW01_03010 [Patescibacteria group bacterium]|nr:hypothetical protein [Patescibacteria group bacterium]